MSRLMVILFLSTWLINSAAGQVDTTKVYIKYLGDPVDVGAIGDTVYTNNAIENALNGFVSESIYSDDGVLSGSRTIDGGGFGLTLDNSRFRINGGITEQLQIDYTSAVNSYTAIAFKRNGANAFRIFGGSVHGLTFYNDNLALYQLGLEDNGRIGMGTSGPLFDLHMYKVGGFQAMIAGNAAASTSFLGIGTTSGRSWQLKADPFSGNEYDFDLNYNSSAYGGDVKLSWNGVTKFMFRDEGDVKFIDYGLGNLAGSEAYLLGVEADGDVVEVDASGIGGKWSDNANGINYNVGNVGVGTTAPDSKLEVDASVDGYDGIKIRNYNTGSQNRAGLTFEAYAATTSMFQTGNFYTGVTGWSDRFVFGTNSDVSNGLLMRTAAGGIQFTGDGSLNGKNLYIKSDGTFQANKYGLGNVTGSEQYVLGVESDGDIVEVDLSSLQDGFEANTDDQNISGSTLNGTDLVIGIEGGANETIDLSSLQDGFEANTDEQTITDLSLSNETLSATLSGGNTETVDLSSLKPALSMTIPITIIGTQDDLEVVESGAFFVVPAAYDGWLCTSVKAMVFSGSGGNVSMNVLRNNAGVLPIIVNSTLEDRTTSFFINENDKINANITVVSASGFKGLSMTITCEEQ